jgi:hypothetical protein
MLLRKVWTDRRFPYRIRPLWDKPKLVKTNWCRQGFNVIKRFEDGHEYVILALHLIPQRCVFGNTYHGIGIRLPFAQVLFYKGG